MIRRGRSPAPVGTGGIGSPGLGGQGATAQAAGDRFPVFAGRANIEPALRQMLAVDGFEYQVLPAVGDPGDLSIDCRWH